MITVILHSMNRKRVLNTAFIWENTKQRSLFTQQLPLSKGVSFDLASYLVSIYLLIIFNPPMWCFHNMKRECNKVLEMQITHIDCNLANVFLELHVMWLRVKDLCG